MKRMPGKYIARLTLPTDPWSCSQTPGLFCLVHHIIIDADGNITETHYTDTRDASIVVTFDPPRRWDANIIHKYTVFKEIHA